MPHTFDAVVVGTGYIGCTIAAELAAAGLRTALLDRGGVAAGASRANYGNVQIQDAELAHSLPLVTAGAAFFKNLSGEQAAGIGYRPLGSLLLIETESQWQLMAARLPALHAAGIHAELVATRRLPELEPLLDSSNLLGACYHPHEAQIYPFALLHATLRRARAHGLSLHLHTKVTNFQVTGGRVSGVQTSRGDFSAGVVVLATGAWTPQLGRMLGQTWNIPHVHGQALATESSPRRLRSHIASAAFFEAMHDDGGDSAGAVLAVSQSAHGNFLLGEAGRVTPDLGCAATPGGQAAVARLTAGFFPSLRPLRVLRGWAAPVAFTADGLPFFGPVSGLGGLFVAAAFKSTVIVTPLVGQLTAQWVTTGRTALDILAFSPDREIVHAG